MRDGGAVLRCGRRGGGLVRERVGGRGGASVPERTAERGGGSGPERTGEPGGGPVRRRTGGRAGRRGAGRCRRGRPAGAGGRRGHRAGDRPTGPRAVDHPASGTPAEPMTGPRVPVTGSVGPAARRSNPRRGRPVGRSPCPAVRPGMRPRAGPAQTARPDRPGPHAGRRPRHRKGRATGHRRACPERRGRSAGGARMDPYRSCPPARPHAGGGFHRRLPKPGGPAAQGRPRPPDPAVP